MLDIENTRKILRWCDVVCDTGHVH